MIIIRNNVIPTVKISRLLKKNLKNILNEEK